MNVYYVGGATHNDHHKEINIGGDVTAEALQQIVTDFFKDEDAEPVDAEPVDDTEKCSASADSDSSVVSLLLPLLVELQMRSFWIRMVKKI